MWHHLECDGLEEPSFNEPSCDDDVDLVEAFREGCSLDILQKVVVDWLEVDDEELQEERTDLFEEAMDSAHLSDNDLNQREDALFKWLDGCDKMGSDDTHNNPEPAAACSALKRRSLSCSATGTHVPGIWESMRHSLRQETTTTSMVTMSGKLKTEFLVEREYPSVRWAGFDDQVLHHRQLYFEYICSMSRKSQLLAKLL